MNGMSFEGHAPTDGRYGFVAFFSAFVPAHWHLITEDWTLLAVDLLFCTRVHPFVRNYQPDHP